MERKDLTPENEALLKLYNDTHEYKIKMEHVEEMYISDNKLTIIWEDYDDDDTFLGYLGYDMDIPDAE
jgi:hypothetical protein